MMGLWPTCGDENAVLGVDVIGSGRGVVWGEAGLPWCCEPVSEDGPGHLQAPEAVPPSTHGRISDPWCPPARAEYRERGVRWKCDTSAARGWTSTRRPWGPSLCAA